AHIDVAPTLLEACGVEPPAGVKFDGRGLMKVLLGKTDDWPERTLFFQWHRGDRPQLHRAFAARGPRWKLLQANGAFDESRKSPETPRFELFDLPADPYEEHDMAAEHPEIVADLKRQYEAWFSEMAAARDFALPRIAIGTEHENPVVLTRQDWRGPAAGWKPNDIGHWELDAAAEGEYQVILHFTPGADSAEAAFGGETRERELKPGEDSCELGPFRLKPGPVRLDCRVAEGDSPRGVQYAEVRRIEN
ncbi:MAG TPA: sulfatase/phosphatase domain-containing protein, partial [Pirellulales bacterium]|nr:sulfatase/phosphatase domain-containing protein [Pirellulales bacterium]